MFKNWMVVALSLFMFASTGDALEIEGVNMPESFQAGNENLVLNGAGVRSKFFMDLYVCGLFLGQKSSDPGKIVESDEPMAIRLHIVSSLITSEKMEKATREGFENSTDGDTGKIADRIERFIGVFVEEIKENDIFDLVYTTADGVKVFKNEALKATIPGLDFKRALFGIWLGEKPAQKSLKKALSGK